MSNLLELANMAAELDDQTETKAGGEYEQRIPPAGPTVARLVEYIEMGKHPQKPYQGKAKPDAETVRLVFELLHPKLNVFELEVDGEKKQFTDRIVVNVKKSLSDKAAFKKLFNKMTYGREGIKHMAQMLNHPFRVVVQHNTTGEGDKKKVYANLNDSDGVYHVGAPKVTVMSEDGMTEIQKDIQVPPATMPLKLFLWDLANKDMWDSLYIDGTREVKNGDKTETVSKNWLQEKILSAKNYKGSKLEALLGGVANLPTSETSDKPEVIAPADDSNPLADLEL